MRKIVLYIAASIDGCIAGSDFSVDWLEEVPNPEKTDYGYAEFYNSIDTTIMGNTTYRQILGFDCDFPYKDKKNYVLSRTAHQNEPYAEFITGDIAGFLKDLKNRPGKNIWLVGGCGANSLLLEHDLIDTIILSIMPVALGKGIGLFNTQIRVTSFSLTGHTIFSSGVVQLTYESD